MLASVSPLKHLEKTELSTFFSIFSSNLFFLDWRGFEFLVKEFLCDLLHIASLKFLCQLSPKDQLVSKREDEKESERERERERERCVRICE